LAAATAVFITGCATQHGVGTNSQFKGPVGLQLYSLRGQFIKNVPGSLDVVKNFGFREVELAGTYNLPADKFKAMLAERGLVAASAHFPYERYRDDPEGVAKEAAALGLKYSGLAWIPHQDAFDEQECRDAIKVFNHAGEVLAKYGIRFFYHAHGYEFQPHSRGTLMDLLMQETDPKKVTFQMDTVWVFFPGQDPVAWLNKYPGRWELMHLKDLKRGVARGELTGKTDPNNDVALGTGQLSWPSLLKTAQKTGVKKFFIEDESADVVNQIPQTLRYLENIQF
jgi:sugar phosphate isomerase/epimerase